MMETRRLTTPRRFMCVICQSEGKLCHLFSTPRSLKRHVFSVHQYSKNFRARCGIAGCAFVTKMLRSLNRHIHKEHNNLEWEPTYDTISSEHVHTEHTGMLESNTHDGNTHNYELPVHSGNAAGSKSDCGSACSRFSSQPSDHAGIIRVDHPCNSIDVNDDNIALFTAETAKTNHQRKVEACLSLARLRAQNSMTETCFESVKDWTTGIISNVTHTVIGGLKSKLDGDHIEQIDNVIELALGMSNPFHGLSEHNFLKVLREDLGYIGPETVILLEEPSPNGIVVRTMQYIPMLRVLSSLMNSDCFIKQVISDHSSQNGYMKDFCDGKYAKSHSLFSVEHDAIQIQLYYDDFEVANPLVSKTSIHKIGALYYTLLNVEPRFRFSKLDRIHLLSLFYVCDLKNPAIGWKKILEPFNQELELLEKGSHNLCQVNGHPIRGTVAQISSDNLAAHSLFGFDQKFSGENVHVSRFCLCTGLDIQQKFHEKDCTLRTQENYREDLSAALELDCSSHGVKEPCQLNSLFFHPVDNFAADAHHDLLEGVIPQTLKPVLQTYIRQKQFFTLKTLNDRLLAFDFNEQDVKNKPTAIRDSKLTDNSRTLKQNASQYWCLLRKLPLIIGDRVPVEDDHWLLILSLLRIVDIVLSPVIRMDVLPFLQSEICCFLREYKRLFPNLTISPKMHYLMHYPRLIEQIGPLARHWVMRYEGKHKLLKKTMEMTGNFVNSAFTMAKRHQLQQAVTLHDLPGNNVDIEWSDGQTASREDLDIENILVSTEVPDNVTLTEKVKVQGTVYRKGHFLWVGWDNNEWEIFGKIRHILIYMNADGEHVVRFIYEIMETHAFTEHFHSFEVCHPSPSRFSTILLHDLIDFNVVGSHHLFERQQQHRLFLNLKYRIDPPAVENDF